MKTVCKDCPDRCVEPSCRNTCKKWAEHLEEQRILREAKEQERYMDYHSDRADKYMQKNVLRRKAGRKV